MRNSKLHIRLLLALALIVSMFGISYGQAGSVQPTATPTNMTSKYYNYLGYVGVDSGLFIPSRDTVFTPTGSKAAITRRTQDGRLYYYDSLQSKWFQASVDTFSTNPTVNSTTFGKYTSGQSPNWKGFTARQAILDAITNCVNPTYTQPTASISSSPTFTTYEYGYNLGLITLSSTFTQNNAGSLTGTTYYVNGSPIAGNTFTISSLISQQSAYVNKQYSQGACKPNSCGDTVCTGRVAAGSVNSSTGNYSVGYRRYYGWITDTTGITTGAQNAAILALVDNSVFSTSAAFGTSGSPISTGNPTGGSAFYVFGYLSSSPTMASITQNGFPSLYSYNTAVLSSFANSQGATISIRIYYNKNVQTSSSTIYTTSN